MLVHVYLEPFGFGEALLSEASTSAMTLPRSKLHENRGLASGSVVPHGSTGGVPRNPGSNSSLKPHPPTSQAKLYLVVGPLPLPLSGIIGGSLSKSCKHKLT